MATMNVSLPEELKDFVDRRVDSGSYQSSSEYVRELIRRDQDVQRFRELITAGAESPIEGDADASFEEAGPEVALKFVDALERVVERLRQHPETGSSRYAELSGVPGLRSTGIRGLPYLVFYFVAPARVELVRLLHGRHDVPEALREE